MPAPYVLSSDLVSAYPAKSVELANFINGYKLDTGPVQNAQTGTSYTFALSDTTKTVTANNAAASAYTVPPQSAVVWEDYTTLRLLNLGAGIVTITAGAGVTLTGTATVAQYSSATLTRTGSNAWTISGSASSPGMVLITPTSVAGSGVTLSGGAVSFSAATTVSVNGCFTASYDNYRFQLVTTASSADTQLNYRSRVSGTDNSSTNYNSQMLQGATSTAAASASTGATSWRFSDIGSANENICSGDIFSPFISRGTAFNNVRYSSAGSSAINAGAMTVTTSYDGFTVFPAAGNITGTLRIYGLRSA